MTAPASYPRLLLTVAVVITRELCRAVVDVCNAIEPEPQAPLTPPAKPCCPDTVPEWMNEEADL